MHGSTRLLASGHGDPHRRPPARLLGVLAAAEGCSGREAAGTSRAPGLPQQLSWVQSRRRSGQPCNQDSHGGLNPASFYVRSPASSQYPFSVRSDMCVSMCLRTGDTTWSVALWLLLRLETPLPPQQDLSQYLQSPCPLCSLPSSFPYFSSLCTFLVLVLSIPSPPLFSPKLPLPKESVWREAPWSGWTHVQSGGTLRRGTAGLQARGIKGIRGDR